MDGFNLYRLKSLDCKPTTNDKISRKWAHSICSIFDQSSVADQSSFLLKKRDRKNTSILSDILYFLFENICNVNSNVILCDRGSEYSTKMLISLILLMFQLKLFSVYRKFWGHQLGKMGSNGIPFATFHSHKAYMFAFNVSF